MTTGERHTLLDKAIRQLDKADCGPMVYAALLNIIAVLRSLVGDRP